MSEELTLREAIPSDAAKLISFLKKLVNNQTLLFSRI